MPLARVILDTSTIIMPITRPASSQRWLMDAWQDGLILPIISEDTEQELLKVMRYPRFQIAEEMIRPMADQYLRYCETVVVPNPAPFVAACRDPTDQKFVDLAKQSEAQYLVSSDEDLLDMRNQMDESWAEEGFAIVTPAQLFAIIKSGKG